MSARSEAQRSGDHPVTLPEEAAAVTDPGALIRRAREARGMSISMAADRIRIDLKARRWRQIEDGHETKGGKPVNVPDLTLAHMARVVGIVPGQLDEIGRTTAAGILREIQRQDADVLERIQQREVDYPDFVGDDPLSRWIWQAEHIASETERAHLIRLHQLTREIKEDRVRGR